jgi:predicted nucleotidyltransferase
MTAMENAGEVLAQAKDTQEPPTRSTVISILLSLQEDLRNQGITGLYLFGSVARGEAIKGSDVDLAFDATPDPSFSLIDQSRIARQISAVLSCKVDFVERDWLRPRIAEHAHRDMIQIF